MASLNYLREMLTMLSEEIRVQQTSLTSSSTWEASTWSSSKSVGSKVIVGLKRYFCCWRKSLTQKQSNTMWKWIPTLCCWMLIYLELFHKFLFMTKHMLLWYHFCRLLHSVAERVLLFLYDQPVSSKRFSPGRNTSRSFISCKIIPPVP